MGKKSPDEIVADIDRRQNEEDKDLIPRAGRMLKEKLGKDLTGGAYVGTRLNMPSNTRFGKMSPSDTKLLNDYDARDIQGNLTKKTDRDMEERRTALEKEAKGMKKGGMVSSASKRADGCAIKGKTRGKMV
jgi:hypothetical protein